MRAYKNPVQLCLVTVICLVALACGKKQSEAEQSYSNACIRIFNVGEGGRKRCDCEASIVAPKLTPGELKAYIASVDLPHRALSSEDLSKFATEHGYTTDEFASLGTKTQAAYPEVSKTCDKAK